MYFPFVLTVIPTAFHLHSFSIEHGSFPISAKAVSYRVVVHAPHRPGDVYCMRLFVMVKSRILAFLHCIFINILLYISLVVHVYIV